MVKRLGLALLLLVGISFALSAQTTIKYAFWGNPDAIGVEKDIIDAFEESHPDIKVTPIAVAYGDYHAKLQILIAGGQAPDVMRVDSYFFQDFLKTGALKDITAQLKADKVDLAKYYQTGLQDSVNAGKYYGLPWATAPLYVFVNTKVFKDAGVAIPKSNWTWDDFVKIARQLTKGEGENQVSGYGMTALEINQFLSMVWGAGEDLFTKDKSKCGMTTPGATKKLDEIAALIKEKTFADPAIFTNTDVNMRYFVQGKIGMMLGAASSILSLQKSEGVDFTLLPFPGTAKIPNVTISKSNIIALYSKIKDAKQAAAAWEFLKFLRAPGEPGELLYMKAKRMPPNVDDLALWDIYADSTKPPKNVAAVTKEINAKYGRILPLRAGWTEIQGLVMPQLQKVYAGSVDAATAMKEIEPQVNAILAKK